LNNPFYLVTLLAGIVFTITACGYGVMTVRQLHEPPQSRDLSDSGDDVAALDHPLVRFMDRYGTRVMIVELVVLGLATCAAIGTDAYWTRRHASAEGSPVLEMCESSLENTARRNISA
jgi:hypothetical protein